MPVPTVLISEVLPRSANTPLQDLAGGPTAAAPSSVFSQGSCRILGGQCLDEELTVSGNW
jgi:hypothetical protein